MARKDEYRNFEELRGKERENVDYSVTVRTVAGSKVAIVAPHGGGIEPLTAELADSIAGNDHNLYALRGLKNEGNKVLHITSHRFDDERALALIAPVRESYHHSWSCHYFAVEACALKGLLNSTAESRVSSAHLYRLCISSKTAHTAALKPRTFATAEATGSGVQIEIYAGLRLMLKGNAANYDRFVAAVRTAL